MVCLSDGGGWFKIWENVYFFILVGQRADRKVYGENQFAFESKSNYLYNVF